MELNIPYSVASLFITVIAFSGVIGGFLLMTLSDIIGRKKSLVIIQSLAALSIVFIRLRRRPRPMAVDECGEDNPPKPCA